MSGTSADRAANTIWPPTLAAGDANHQVRALTTSSSAARAAISGPKVAKCYMTFIAYTADCFIIMKKGTAAASVTTTTGWPLVAGQPQAFWVDPAVVDDVEAITASTGGTLKWYISSPLYEQGAGQT